MNFLRQLLSRLTSSGQGQVSRSPLGMLKNKCGATNPGKHLKYGKVKGHSLVIGQNYNGGGLTWAGSQVVGNQSGKFVYMNAGAVTLCLDAVAYIFGWANERARTPTSGDVVSGGVDIALDAIYRVPVNSGTFANGMIGDLCDLSISSNVQGAQLDASVENLCIVCNGDLVNNAWVDLKINPAVQGAAAGVEA